MGRETDLGPLEVLKGWPFIFDPNHRPSDVCSCLYLSGGNARVHVRGVGASAILPD